MLDDAPAENSKMLSQVGIEDVVVSNVEKFHFG